MATTPFDSALYRNLFHDSEVGSLFSDSAEVRAMMLVEGALAKAQGSLGIIPELSAAFLERSSREIQIDPGGLAAETGSNGVPVPALVAAMRKAMEAPEHAQYLHWGATTQDIMDTALALRLRQVLALYEKRLSLVLRLLADMAETHAETPIAGRTWMQVATPTSFGAVLAGWGLPLLRLRERLDTVRDGCLIVSLSGAAGTSSAIGPKSAELRSALGKALKLRDPQTSWHSSRDGITALAGWATQVSASLAKIGEDMLLMTQSGLSELRLKAAGSSSTMPQKQNPVEPSLLVALGRHVVAMNGVIQGAAIHRQQRDAAAWFTEWLSLGQISMATGRALCLAENLLKELSPDIAAMQAHVEDEHGLIYAEALQFRLAENMPRPDAQEAVKDLCKHVIAEQVNLADAAKATWPDANLDDLFMPQSQLGQAPADARRFAELVRA